MGGLLEFGADCFTGGYRPHPCWRCRRILAKPPKHVAVRELGKPANKPLRPEAMDIMPAQIGNAFRPPARWSGHPASTSCLTLAPRSACWPSLGLR